MSDIRHNVSWDITAPGQRTFTDHPGGVNNPVIIDKITHETRAAEPTIRSGAEVTTQGYAATQEGVFVPASNTLQIKLLYYTANSLFAFSNVRFKRYIVHKQKHYDSTWRIDYIGGREETFTQNTTYTGPKYVVEEKELPDRYRDIAQTTRDNHLIMLEGEFYHPHGLIGVSRNWDINSTYQYDMQVAQGNIPSLGDLYYYRTHKYYLLTDTGVPHVLPEYWQVMQHMGGGNGRYLFEPIRGDYIGSTINISEALPPKMLLIKSVDGTALFVGLVRPTILPEWSRPFTANQIKEHVQSVLEQTGIKQFMDHHNAKINVSVSVGDVDAPFIESYSLGYEKIMWGDDEVVRSSCTPDPPWQSLMSSPTRHADCIAAVESISCVNRAYVSLNLTTHLSCSRTRNGELTDFDINELQYGDSATWRRTRIWPDQPDSVEEVSCGAWRGYADPPVPYINYTSPSGPGIWEPA